MSKTIKIMPFGSMQSFAQLQLPKGPVVSFWSYGVGKAMLVEGCHSINYAMEVNDTTVGQLIAGGVSLLEVAKKKRIFSIKQIKGNEVGSATLVSFNNFQENLKKLA